METTLSETAKDILSKLDEKTRLGDLRKIAKEIKKNHDLALELWSSEVFTARLLAILIMDKNHLTEKDANRLAKEMEIHDLKERNNLMDWLMANQLTKDKKKIALLQSWQDSPLKLQRRAYWYYQGRLRWTGQTPPDNTEELVTIIEKSIADEVEEVQWAMNFLLGWVGVFDADYRDRCMAVGEKTGLYKDEMVAKGCTPNYLPDFIAIEAGKRNL